MEFGLVPNLALKVEDDNRDLSPRPKSIHIILRPEDDGEQRKISEQERKNMKKQFKNVIKEFHEEEATIF